MRPLIWTFLAVSSLAPNSVAAQEDAFFLLSGAQLECLAQNAAQYLTSTDHTLFIKPGDCGSEQTGKTLSFIEMTLNAAPNIEIVEDRETPDEIVVFTREDFLCITDQVLPEAADLVAFYPQGCRLVVRAP
ncbi:hypothetical protein GGQ68_004801 [Sagittula marina]|uniref:Uncharacterized protein n=1 Tax=Sagittula marina TaxID=943940 RepID=A0A7W6GWH5_9RHOB|nr:hypothetical protein [Sagittula marina]MBB3988444.1 hypothetical protein [Sagittula marina]